MDIKSLLNQFKILDKNNDGILQASEVKNNSFKNSVWENIAKPETSLVDFVITGLSIQSANPKEQNLSAFDKMHAKLVKQNIYPGTYLNGYCYYSNGVKLYTKDVSSYDEIPNFPGCDWAKDAKGVDISNLKLSDEQLLNMIIDDYTTMSDEQKAVYEKAKASMNQMGCGIEKLHEQGFRGSGAMALLD